MVSDTQADGFAPPILSARYAWRAGQSTLVEGLRRVWINKTSARQTR
jgi:hypothetical protein